MVNLCPKQVLEADSCTWKLPWVILVEINLGDDRDGETLVGGLLAEVMDDKLLVGGVEPESWWQIELGLGISRSSSSHFFSFGLRYS